MVLLDALENEGDVLAEDLVHFCVGYCSEKLLCHWEY